MAHELQSVLSYGPIVHRDEDTGYLVTINGAYLNLWIPVRHDKDGNATHWTNPEARARGGRDLYVTTVAQAIDAAEAWISDLMAPDDEE